MNAAFLRPLGMLLAAIGAMAWPRLVLAHEVRPALLQISERADHRFDILWKQPIQGDVAVHLVPHISGGLLERVPSVIETAQNFQIQSWQQVDAGTVGLNGRTVEIEGLRQTLTDVMVSVSFADGQQLQEILRPPRPSFEIHLHGSGLAVPAYLMLGIRHILTGVDHLCFVLALLLLVRQHVMLLKTITAFTIAHSLTLAATTLHWITVRPEPIEALVALSIVFVAVELAHLHAGRIGLTARQPWVVAFAFGLLHGCAFAGALNQVGLPPNAIPLSLLLFNLGVEAGQGLFIVAFLGIAWCLRRLTGPVPAWSARVAPYTIGTFAVVWFLQRVQTALVIGGTR